MIPTPLHYLGYALLSGSALFMLFMVWSYATGRSRANLYQVGLRLLAALYPLGMGFKLAVIGPEFTRWHLTDLGFVVFVALMALYERFNHRDKPHGAPENLRILRNCLLATLLLSVLYEIFTGLIYNFRPGQKPVFIGSFDRVDVLMYMLGTAAALVLVYFWHRRTLAVIALVKEMKARQDRTQKWEAERQRSRRQRELSMAKKAPGRTHKRQLARSRKRRK